MDSVFIVSSKGSSALDDAMYSRAVRAYGTHELSWIKWTMCVGVPSPDEALPLILLQSD